MITLLIPTLNRSDFIERYLFYLRDNAFGGCVCIGDSSDNWHLERTRRIIKENKFSFEIIHRACPGLNLIQCIREMLPLIQTPYAMYICDDDLVVPRTIALCIQFLEENPDYSAATGIVVHCFLESCGEVQKVGSVIAGRLNPIEDASASQRLINLLNDYSVVAYSVARSEQFKKRWPLDASFSDVSFSAELLPCCMLVVQGKIKKINQLFAIRQIHERRYIMPDTFDWITTPGWLSSYQDFSNYLIEKLADKEKIPIDKARKVVKQAFWAFLNRVLSKKFQKFYEKKCLTGFRNQIKSKVKNISFINNYLLPIWRRIKYTTSALFPSDSISLVTLLSPFSPYHSDFMAAYRAITNPLEDWNEEKL